VAVAAAPEPQIVEVVKVEYVQVAVVDQQAVARAEAAAAQQAANAAQTQWNAVCLSV
jgi:hypothetical protein